MTTPKLVSHKATDKQGGYDVQDTATGRVFRVYSYKWKWYVREGTKQIAKDLASKKLAFGAIIDVLNGTTPTGKPAPIVKPKGSGPIRSPKEPRQPNTPDPVGGTVTITVRKRDVKVVDPHYGELILDAIHADGTNLYSSVEYRQTVKRALEIVEALMKASGYKVKRGEIVYG